MYGDLNDMAALLPPDFAYLRRFSNVAVSGPQRSGTRICTRMIASDLSLEYIDEVDFSVNDADAWIKLFTEGYGRAVHCPVMSHLLHRLPENTGVVFMERDIADIVRSQARIDWQGNDATLLNYYLFPWSWIDCNAIKYMYWERVQKPQMIGRAFDVRYESLRGHPLWVDRRDGWAWNRTAADE